VYPSKLFITQFISKQITYAPILLLFLVLQNQIVFCQNLVNNSSFEIYSRCPRSISHKKKFIVDWYSPSKGTPDYFNSCSKGSAGIPNNFAGYQYPKSGNGYIGFGFANLGYGFSREYIATKLDKKLKKDSLYVIEFHISLARSSKFAISEIGVYLSKNKINYKTERTLPVKPQLVKTFKYYENVDSWTHLSFIYKAEGNERFVAIGNFQDDFNLDFITRSDTIVYSSKVPPSAYYFLDDVRVRRANKFDMDYTIDLNNSNLP